MANAGRSRSRPKNEMMYSPNASPAKMTSSEKMSRLLFMCWPW
ncbi:MAG TPA: hypothetical protein VED22_06090 [Nitrososphaerales archaeon]|nr:hypothetical protein [Nitrososphaerales archaeon]